MENKIENLAKNIESEIEQVKNKLQNVLEDIAPLKNIIKTNEEKIIKLSKKLEELKKQMDLMDVPIDKGNTADIEDAIIKKSLAAVKYYHHVKPCVIHQEFEINQNPMFLASQHGCTDIIRFLLSKGADIEGDSEILNPLLEASCAGHLPVVKILLDSGAYINYQQRNGQTALHNAIYWNRCDIVKFLIERGADRTLKNAYGSTSIQWAFKYGKKIIRQYLSQL